VLLKPVTKKFFKNQIQWNATVNDIWKAVMLQQEIFQIVTNLMYSSRTLFAHVFFKLLSSSFLFTPQMTSSTTWPFDCRDSTFYGWSIVTMRLSITAMEIWRLKDNAVTTLTFWGHVTSSVMWLFDSCWSTSYGWFIVTMRLSSTIMEIWPFEVLPGRLFQEQRSVVGRSVLNITLILYTPLRYVRHVAREE